MLHTLEDRDSKRVPLYEACLAMPFGAALCLVLCLLAGLGRLASLLLTVTSALLVGGLIFSLAELARKGRSDQ
jgi:hypothetical protein